MVLEFVGSLNYFILAIQDERQSRGGSSLDMYCRGMIFGNKGSGLLVRIANVLKAEKESNTAEDGTRKKNKKGNGIFGALKDAFDEVSGDALSEMVMSGIGALSKKGDRTEDL